MDGWVGGSGSGELKMAWNEINDFHSRSRGWMTWVGVNFLHSLLDADMGLRRSIAVPIG